MSFSAIEATGRQIFEHDRIVVTFIDETPNALYRVLVSAEGEPSPLLPLEAPTPLSAFEAGAATARRLALQSPFQPTRRNEVPVGGTYRIEGGRDDDHPYPGSGAHGGTRALESLG